MVNWWAIVIIAFVIFFIYLYFRERFKRGKTKFFLILVILLLLFFYFTGRKVVRENDINLKTFNGVVSVGKLYFSWLGHAIKNIGTLTGNVVKMDWKGNVTGK